MTLQTGARLGPYEIVFPLGAGGMGEVYRANDTKLGREVAVKVLPAALANDPDALSRFEREARAVAQLSHPNILAIFDFGREGETAYAVMELLEGETLRRRLENGALPARKAIDLAVQMAEGLAAAHEKGIVHRDLKPENIFITREGRVKLLDFGLARKATPGSGAVSRLQTVDQQTQAGRVMGTVAYMSPEQVRGETADQRSDVFSFGSVLYEMVAGRQAFLRDSAPETMTAILKDEPPEITVGGPGWTPALQRIVQHCLEKKPGERFQSARDIAFDLQTISTSALTTGRSTAAGRRRLHRWIAVIAALLAVAALLTVAVLAAYRNGRQAGLRDAAQVSFRQVTFRPQAIAKAAFMPDGETIVYSAALEGVVPELFVIRPEYPDAQPLGLPRTHLLSISSKGELAILTNPRFRIGGTLARVSLGGAAPREILDNVQSADWSPDGAQLAITRRLEGKTRLEYPIGKVLYEIAGDLSDPRVSPRGDLIALFEHPTHGDTRGSVIVIDRAGRRTVLSGEYWGERGLAWSRSGDEVLFTASTAGAQTLYGVDLQGRRRVALQSAGGLTMHDVSAAGRWLVTRDDFRFEISVMAPGEKVEHDLSWLDASVYPSLSMDGTTMAFTDQSAPAGLNYQVCLRKASGGPVVHLGDGAVQGLSPEGNSVLAIIYTPPQLLIYPVGTGETRRLPRGNLETYQSASWFPDGKTVIVCGNEAHKASRCYAQDVAGGQLRPITPEGTTRALVSPDGQQVVYSKSGGGWLAQRLAGGEPRGVPGLTKDDKVVRWNADSRSLSIFHVGEYLPYRFERLDLATGGRDLLREVAPANRTGVIDSIGSTLTEDAGSYAYGYTRLTSQLFVVEGAQ